MVLVAALSLAACAPTSGRRQPSAPPGSTPSPSSTASAAASPSGIQHPTGADELVFRLSVAGGLRPPSPFLDLPQLSLYGDGRMITSDPAHDVFPRQMLPSLQVRQVTPAGIQQLLSLAREAGVLDGDAHYDEPTIADAPTSTFVAVANGTRRVVSAYALGLGSGGETEPGRAALLAFRDALADLDTLLSPEMGPAAPYEIDRLQIVIEPDGPIPDQDVTIVPWPLSAEPATIGEPYPYGENARCVVVSGSELRALQPALRETDELTRWSSGRLTYEFLVRPLLPGEAECSDAIGRGGRR